MADDDYHKKLGEMQKYVPFLETTIKRLKSEKDKPREAQISKLQSLLVILTDSKKKLKLDALKKCEEVILKLYDKVEKKPPDTTMHKYMCRTPPEEKNLKTILLDNSSDYFDPTFLVARQKLKQTDTTPASPSPPLEKQINNITPVIIPTEKIPTNNETIISPDWTNYETIPKTLNWPSNAFNPNYPINMNQVWQDPNSQNWTMPPNPNEPQHQQQQSEIYRNDSDNNKIWNRETLSSKSYKHKKIDREIINYSDALSNSITSLEDSPKYASSKIKIVGNNKEIIPIDTCPKIDKPKIVSRKNLPLPPAPQSRNSLEKEILPLNKPPLSDRDLQDLLSPVTDSSGGGQSPIFNEDMDLDKLEELKAKLCKELAEEKPKHKKKSKEKNIPSTITTTTTTTTTTSTTSVTKKPPKVIERVIKESNNIFGSLLSSIDEQIMGKSKDKKPDKKDTKKDETKKISVKENKVLNVKDIASINEKVKSNYFKSDETKDSNTKSSKSSTKDDKKTEKKKDDSKKTSKDETHKDKKSSTTKTTSTKNSTTNNSSSSKDRKSLETETKTDKVKEIIIPKSMDDNVYKTVEDIMKNLKESINKPAPTPVPAPDPLSKFGDLVKEKSDQLCDNKPIEMPSSGRLSDKYPHKRKSIDCRASESPISDSNVPKIPQEPVQPVKLTDPRLRAQTQKNPNLVSPPMKELHFEPPIRNIDFDQRNFNNRPNPEFSFQNSFNNINPNNFNNNNNRGNNIFCNDQPQPVRPPIVNEMHQMPFPPDDAFQNVGCRTPGDPFLNPIDPFCNQMEQFINPGPPRTPGDPFLSPVDPFLNRAPGPPGPGIMGPGPEFHNFNQFNNNNNNRNDFPMNRNPDQFNPNWNRPNNQFPPVCGDNFNPNQRFNQPEPNQYDLSQMNPIDFYDNNAPNNNRFEPEFNSFRGRGNIRGNFGRGGRGGGGPPPPPPDRNGGNPFWNKPDPRQFRSKPPLLPVPNKFSPNEEQPHKEDRRSRFDDVRESRDHRGDRDYRRSRFSKEDEHRSRSTDERHSRFNKREEPVRKFVREDPRRKSVDENVDKPKEVTKEAVVEKPPLIVDVKTKEEIQSPLDSLYSMETKKVGKGYGLQSFKIPKIKKNEETTKDDKDTKTSDDTTNKEEEEVVKEEIVAVVEQPEAATTSKQPNEEIPKTEADLKLDMFNNFMKHIFETCDSSVLFQYLDRCGFALPNAKTKRIRRIIDSDSSETEDEQKKEDSETDKPTPEPPIETPEPEEQKPTSTKPEKIVETVSERIKSRRRKPVVYSSDSSPDKQQKKTPTPDEDPIKPTVKTQAKTRRKNALELLQEDIREMFISEGVLTATGKRMCRMMKEHQETGFISPNTETSEQKDEKENEEETPLVKRKEKTKTTPTKPQTRQTRKSPRVLLEKIEVSSITSTSDKESGPEEDPPEIKKPPVVVATRRTRRSNTISGEFLELDENGVVSKVQEKKKKVKQKTDETLDTSFEDDVSIKSDSNIITTTTTTTTKKEAIEEEEIPVIKKKRIRRRGRGCWKTGVIKNNKKKKQNKNIEKNPNSPALTISTENPDDQLSINDDDLELDDDEQPKNTYDEEYSLLKVDINEDVNYYLDNGNKFMCKLCDYKGKLIVHHYRSKHPESENMISRLSPEQASAAKIESKEFNFQHIIPYEEATKGKKRRTTFICRFCLLTFKQEFTSSFFDHICCHTGEYRYKCDKCPFSTGVKKTLSTHCHSLHPDIEKPLIIKPIYEAPPNFRLVFGYLCSACNFTQLLKENVDKHIRVSHPNQDITIIKISMSTKPIPLTDLKKLEEDDESVVSPPQTEVEETVVEVQQKEPDLTVFMVPEEISQQEKLIDSERLKKMEEIQSNVVPRRSKLQFVDKLKNKLDSVESEIALLESMEAENAASISEEFEEIPDDPNLDDPNKQTNDWISITSSCSLACPNQPVIEEPELNNDEDLNVNEDLNINEELTSLALSPNTSLSSSSKRTGFLDTIQRLAAQLQNNRAPSLSDCEDGEPLYYSPEVTPDNSPERKKHLDVADNNEAIKLNAGSIEIQFFNHKNVYLCLIPNCCYTSNLKTSFRKHLMDDHKNDRVNCGLCADDHDDSSMEWDLCGLFLHMLDQHKAETPVKKSSTFQIKEEIVDPVDQPSIESIKKEVVSSPDVLQPGSIRLRRISGDLLSSFSTEIPEYPTISIPEYHVESVISEPDISQILEQQQLQHEADIESSSSSNETGFLQISNVRTLTPEEENHLQINKMTSPIKELPTKAFKKIIPKAFILNMKDLTQTPGVKNALVTKTITSENKPTKTIIFRKSPFDQSVPKLALIKSPKVKSFIATTTAKLKMGSGAKITFVAPATGTTGTGTSKVFKTPATEEGEASTSELQKLTKQILKPLRLNKSELILSKMTEFPKILDFYKCPCLECAFSTNDRLKFQEHFAAHNKTASGQYCVYCSSSFAPNDLLDHLEVKHSMCLYQCALCFYRARYDLYITVHQSFCHQLNIPKYYIVKDGPNLSSINCGPDIGVIPRSETILPYNCTLESCNRTFFTMNDFKVHMKLFHKRQNVCSICKFELNNLDLLVGHYVSHNIANFQCRYCKFGSEKPQILLRHYAVDHYNKSPIVYKREYKSGGITSSHPNDAARLKDIIEINLSYLVKLKRNPQNNIETQNHIPAATVTFSEDEECGDDVQQQQHEQVLVDKNPDVVDEEEDELILDPITGEMIPVDPAEKQNICEVDPLNINDLEDLNELNDEEQVQEHEQEFVDSGLSGSDLYICGTSGCTTRSSNLREFRDHLYTCNVLTNNAGWYTCFHCKKRLKHIGSFVNHLDVHGIRKYTCSLCPYRARMEPMILKHMKIQHKIQLAKVIPIDKTNPNSNFVAVSFHKQPKSSKKDDELYEKELQDAIKHTRQQIELIQTTKTTKQDDKNSFGPEDIDKLPRPPIFAQEIKCKVCSYNTKVRSNMLKHLTAHVENKPVAETAPVNPVPCLEKNELMFDKMTNLAASSHTSGRMGPKKDERIKEKIPPKDSSNCPGFIAASKRYVCGSNSCNYLTHGDSMLRHHLTALHIDELNYKCPHCHIELAPEGLTGLAIDNILFHLKMHDLHLYKCNECQFHHYQKHKIERHITEQHPNATTKNPYQTIRELDSSANLDEVRSATSSPEKSAELEDPNGQPWRCGFCDFKTATRTTIQNHAANIHKIRSQFKCGKCEFRCSARNNYNTHFKNKHPADKVEIISVYYKVLDELVGGPIVGNLSGSDVETNKSFDTTPLWSKNKTGVKHIRGILLDDSPNTNKRPKIIEKMAENVPTISTSDVNVNDKSDVVEKPKKSKKMGDKCAPDGGHNLRFPGSYGANRNQLYVCPTCGTFETKNSKQFVIHLYKEINYFRYTCNFCAHKSTHMAEAQKHFKEFHPNETVINNKQFCTVLRYNAKAENWVEKCIQSQLEGIKNYQNQIIKQEDVNSSTETVVLETIKPPAVEEEQQQNEELEKPLLTPQRRSTRVPIQQTKPDLNESLESNEPPQIEHLNPPILEPQVVETRKDKKANNLKCKYCSFVGKSPKSLQKHDKKHFEIKPYKCDLCKYIGSQLAHLQSHFYFKHPSEPLQYSMDAVPETPVCRLIKRKRENSQTEVPAKIAAIAAPAPEIIKSEIKTEIMGPIINYVCYHCPRRSQTLDCIREHFVEAHEKVHKNIFKYKKLITDKPKKTKYSCEFCEWTGHPDSLKQHHFQMHIDKEYVCVKDTLFKCEICMEAFNKLAGLKKHFNRAHPSQNLLYQNITKEHNDEYIETIEIIEEILQIKSEQPQEINCEFCVLSFGDLVALRAHHDLVHNHLEFQNTMMMMMGDTVIEQKKYKCPQCGHTSNSFAAMRDHLRNHNKPYKCGYCELTASYPSVLITHHLKEHVNIEPSVLVVAEAQKRNEELRDNLLHLENGEYVKMKHNLKRQISETTGDEPPTKLLILEEKKSKPKQQRNKKSSIIIKKQQNVARKSTATPPRIQQNVAKKSTTPRPINYDGFSYYGTKPLHFDDIKNIKSELPIMGKDVPLNIGSMSQILSLFPVVELQDIGNNI